MAWSKIVNSEIELILARAIMTAPLKFWKSAIISLILKLCQEKVEMIWCIRSREALICLKRGLELSILITRRHSGFTGPGQIKKWAPEWSLKKVWKKNPLKGIKLNKFFQQHKQFAQKRSQKT